MSQHNTVTQVQKLTDIDHKKPGNYQLPNGQIKTVTGIKDNVDQSQVVNTDISKLLEPARKAGLLRHNVQFEGEYDDIPSLTYEDAVAITAKAQQMFDGLPRDIKNRFNNSPKEFLQFVENPANFS